jgi:hypothetical protein
MVGFAGSVLDAKRRIKAGRIEGQFFNVIDAAKTRPGGQIVLEGFDLRGRSFGESFHAAIRKVLNVTDDLVPRGRALCEKAIAHALDFAADDEASRDAASIC